MNGTYIHTYTYLYGYMYKYIYTYICRYVLWSVYTIYTTVCLCREEKIEGLLTVRRLAMHHEEVLIPQIGPVIQAAEAEVGSEHLLYTNVLCNVLQ